MPKEWKAPTNYGELWQQYWEKVQGRISWDEARAIHRKWVKIGSSV